MNSNRQITVEHLLDLIDQLPKEKQFDYIIPGKNRAVLIGVDHNGQSVAIDKINDDGTKKSAGMTTEALKIIVDNAFEKVPFSVDSIFNGSGSARSTWEAILANTSEFYTCRVDRQKHLIWIPDDPHALGEVTTYDGEFQERPHTDNDNVIEPSIANYITKHDSENFTNQQLADILSQSVQNAPADSKTFAIHNFGILYAPHIINGSEIGRLAGLESFSASITDAKKIGINLRKHIKEIAFKMVPDLKGYSLQLIYYGAPGTGKSHKAEEVTANYPETVRTTFHPDSDYSTFVGAYKPTTTNIPRYGLNSMGGTVAMEADGKVLTENKIEYKFVKQAFLKAYIKAWNLFADTCEDSKEMAPQFLVIEEINRGNCAQIFGDLFQLLDRKNDFSEYPIEADEDIRKALREENPEDGLSFGKEGLQLNDEQKAYINEVYDKPGQPSRKIAEKICSGQLLVLPPNFYIWATMNTSDQSLFPIDSAFKRRWDWKYVPITNKKKDYKIRVKAGEGKIYDFDWWNFLQKVNEAVNEVTGSEDKKLGYFFCKADEDNTVNADTFVGKVLFYLFGDVLKDYDTDDVSFTFEDTSYTLLKWKDGDKQGRFKFSQFFNEEGDGDDKMVAKFLDNINVDRVLVGEPHVEQEEDEDEEVYEVDTDGESKTRDQSRYSLNGEGNYKKGPVVLEALRKYMELHSAETSIEVFDKWKGLNLDRPSNFIQTEQEFTDKKSKSRDKSGNDRANKVVCSDGGVLYISKEWNIDTITIFVDKINAQDWGINIEKIQ